MYDSLDAQVLDQDFRGVWHYGVGIGVKILQRSVPNNLLKWNEMKIDWKENLDPLAISLLKIVHLYITGWWFEPLWKILVNWDD